MWTSFWEIYWCTSLTAAVHWNFSSPLLAIVKEVEEEAVPKATLSLHSVIDQWFLSIAEGFAHSFMHLFRNFSTDCIGKSRVRLPFSYRMMRIEANLWKIKLPASLFSNLLGEPTVKILLCSSTLSTCSIERILVLISLFPLISSFSQPWCFCDWRTDFVVWGGETKSLSFWN